MADELLAGLGCDRRRLAEVALSDDGLVAAEGVLAPRRHVTEEVVRVAERHRERRDRALLDLEAELAERLAGPRGEAGSADADRLHGHPQLDRSTVPSATRCSIASAQRTCSDTGFQAVRGSPAACRSATRRASSAFSCRISSSVGGSMSGSETCRSRAATVVSCGTPVGVWRQIAIGIAEAYGICSGRVGSSGAAARACERDQREPLAEQPLRPGLGVERLERDDVAGAALQEDALPARPAAHVLAERPDEVGGRLGHVGADHDRVRGERDDGADRASVLAVDPKDGDVAVALLLGVPAEDRPALDALAAVDRQPLGGRARPANACRLQAPCRLGRYRHEQVADHLRVVELLGVPLPVAADLRPAGRRRRGMGVLRVDQHVVAPSSRRRRRSARAPPAPRRPRRRRGRRRAAPRVRRRRARAPSPPSARPYPRAGSDRRR